MRRRMQHTRTAFWCCVVKVREKNRLQAQRYRATAKGQAHLKRNNDRRIYVGQAFHSHADTTEQAQAIRQAVRTATAAFTARQRKDQDAFKSRFAGGTESQGGDVVPVSVEAAAGGD